MCVHHMCVVLVKSRGGHVIPYIWIYRHLLAAMWTVGIEPGPLEEQSMFLTTS